MSPSLTDYNPRMPPFVPATLLLLTTLLQAAPSPSPDEPTVRAFPVRRAISLDGDLSEWDRRGPIRIEEEGQRNLFEHTTISRDWQGPDDASAVVYLAYDADHLYLGGEVRDDLRHHDDQVWWNGDCLELFLDVDRDGDRDQAAWNEDDFQICLMPYNQGRPWGVSKHGRSSLLSDGDLHGVQVVGRDRDDAGYSFEVRIPLGNFPGFTLGSDRMGVNIAVHDHDRLADGRSRHSYLTINGAARNYSDTSNLLDLEFIGEPMHSGRAAAGWLERMAPWIGSILISLLMIGLVARVSRPVFEWVDTRLASWRRLGVFLILFLAFVVFGAPYLVARFLEWRVESGFENRSTLVGRVVAEIADEAQLHEGRGLDEPDQLLTLLRGRPIRTRPLFDHTCFPLRPAPADPNHRRSGEGVPVLDFGFPLLAGRQYAFALPEPTVLTRLFLFGSTRFDESAWRRPGATPEREQAIEVGVRMLDGTERSQLFPAIDRTSESMSVPASDRYGLAWEDTDGAVEQYFLGTPTVGDLLVKAITVRVRDPDLEFRLNGVTYARSNAADELVPLPLARSSLAGPPAALWDGYPHRVQVSVPQVSGRSSHPVRIGRRLDVLYLFHNTVDSRVLDEELNGVEVARLVVVGEDEREWSVPIRAGVNIQYGLLDPAQRPSEMESELAFVWEPEGETPEQIEVLAVTLPPERAEVPVREVRLLNLGPLSSIQWFALTGGVLARQVDAGSAATLQEQQGELSLAPGLAEAIADLGLCVFEDGRVTDVDLEDPHLSESLKGARLPLGGGSERAEAGELQRVILAGDLYLVRYFELEGATERRITVASVAKVHGLALLRKMRDQAGLVALFLIVPLLLFYVLDAATRIARLRLRLTTLLVATSLVPIVALFAVLYNVVASDRARLRESRGTAALQEVRGRMLEMFRQTQRTAREVLDSDLARVVRQSGELERERIESYLHEVVALRPAPGLDLAVRLEVELDGGQRLRFHDRPDRASASRFDLTENGIRYHWDQLVFLWSLERAGASNRTRVVVAGEMLADVTHDLGRSTGAQVGLLTLKGFPIGGDRRVAAEQTERDVESIREQGRPQFRSDSTGALVATDLLRAPGGEPAALLEVALPPDAFLLDVVLTRMPLEQFFFWLCVLTLAAAVFMGAIATWRITAPVEALESAARRVATGDLDVAVETGARGEMGRLARSFNIMTARLKRRAQEQERLERATSALTNTIELEGTADAGLAALTEEPPARAGALYRTESDRDHLRRLGRPFGEGGAFPLLITMGQGWERVLAEPEPIIAGGDAEEEQPALVRRLLGNHLTVILPLILSDRSIGVAVLHYGQEVTRAQLEEALPMLLQLAGQISVALENSRLYRLAVADPLTGLYVESYFLNRLAEEVDRAQHQANQLSLLRIELSDVERLERTFGPSGGRESRLRTARAIRAEAREMYLVARAGNGFLVLLPSADSRTVESFRDRVLRRIGALRIGTGNGIGLTAHAGLATFPEDGRSTAFLLDAAARDLAGARRKRVQKVLKEGDGPGEGAGLDIHPYVFQSRSMRELLNQVARVAPSSASVLVLGETGTGKEVVAELLHRWSDRAHKPFYAINCSAVPETLLEAELFGYEKGAFTGANRAKPGQLELATGGTVFLDEVGDMPASIQAKLLRVLQDRVVVRLGGRRPTDVDVRIVAATNRDLKTLIETGAFRSDLYFRLKVVSLTVPPLRERRDDIPALVDLFVREFNADNSRTIRGVSPAALDLLHRFPWPGNVRELKNVLNRSMLLTEGQLVLPDALQFDRTVSLKPLSGGRPTEGRDASSGLDGERVERDHRPTASLSELNERQQLLLAHLHEGDTIRSRDYFELVGVSPRTGLRDLNDLMERGLIERLGKRRAAAYRLAGSS